MGLYDRDYYQDGYGQPNYGQPNRFSSGSRMMVTNLVIINGVLFLLELLLTREGSIPGQRVYWFRDILAVEPEVLKQPWLWWKLITYGFAHDPRGIGHVFWNMFGLWVFGRDVELIYGRRELLRIYLATVLLGGLFWCLKEVLFFQSDGRTILLGASGAVTAIILLFVFHYPKRTIMLMFVLPVPAWVVGLLIIGGNLLMLLQAQSDVAVAFDVHLVGAAFAIAYFRFGWNLGRITPNLGRLRDGAPRIKRGPKLKVHDPDRDDRYKKQDEEAGRILDKVNRQGMDSLTSKEKRILEDYSRRMRRKHR